MAFVAQAADRRVICYATANLLRDEAESMVGRFPKSVRFPRDRVSCPSTDKLDLPSRITATES